MATQLSDYRSIVLWRKGRMSQSDPSRRRITFRDGGLLGKFCHATRAARTDAIDPKLSRRRLYSITASARPRRGNGNVIPMDLAVFILMTNSTLVDCWTGKSAGFSPLRIRPV
jgi:hypothetical protein